MRLDDIHTVAIIGAGIMGAGIAQVFAQAGYQLRLLARHEHTLQRALAQIRANETLPCRAMVELRKINHDVQI
jgi:3-hydroxyacyl-CoA dehydrogenase